jgi:hypothetical protein
MASPLFDALHLKLSRKLTDPVAAAATDGGEVSSALRTDYLNRANKFIQMLLWTTKPDLFETYLQGLIATSSITFASAGAALPSDFSYAITLQQDSPVRKLKWFEPSRKIELDMATVSANSNPFFSNCFTILGNKIYAYQAGTILSSGTGTFYYIKNDQRASSGDSSDIMIDAIWHETLVDLAASYHYSDKKEITLQKASEDRATLVLGVIGKQNA